MRGLKRNTMKRITETSVENSSENFKKVDNEIEILETYANTYDEYLKLLSFYTEVDNFDTLIRRLNTFQKLLNYPFLKKSIADFANFKEFEKYVFDNKNWLLISETRTFTSSNDLQSALRFKEDLNNDDLKKYARKIEPTVTQPYLDKAIYFFKKEAQTFEEILKQTGTWIANKETFQKLKISFENYKNYNQLKYDVRDKLPEYENVQKFLKKLPITFQQIAKRENYFIYHLDDLKKLKNEIENRFQNPAMLHHFYASLNSSHDSVEKIENAVFQFTAENSPYNLWNEKIKTYILPFADVVFHGKNILIIKISAYLTAKTFGSTRWCLANHYYQWKNYVTEHDRNFYIVYNLKEHYSPMCGITMKNGAVCYLYNQNNENVFNIYVDKNAALMGALSMYDKSNFFLKILHSFCNIFKIDLFQFKRAD